MQQKRAERYHKHERIFTEKPPVRQLLYCVPGNRDRCQQISQKIKDKGDMIIAPEQRSGNHKIAADAISRINVNCISIMDIA